MATKRNTQLHLAEPIDEEELIINKRYRKRQQKKRFIVISIILVLIIGGTYLLLSYQTYGNVNTSKTYTNAGSDNNSYLAFDSGIIRYTSDGVVYLDKKNTTLWNQPYQIQNPIIEANDDAFAIADQGGNTIMVFTKDGLKGEIETSLTIEKIAVSNQGIVSAILKDSKKPQIISYDATGNILVENDVDVNESGYPVALAMSPDGNLLGVSYVNAVNGTLQSKISYYNFGSVGQDKSNNQVATKDYSDTIMPTIYFMDKNTSVVVGDDRFIINSGAQIPEEKKVINLKKEIKNTFHTKKYIGLILKNTESKGYELRIYNTNGKKVMSTDFTGEYGNVKMIGKEIIMYEGSRACIYELNGIRRFRGRLTLDIDEIVPVLGINKYLLIGTNETQVVRLVK